MPAVHLGGVLRQRGQENMSPQRKLALRRFALRWLRKLFDWLEDRLHTEEIKLRNDLSGRHQVSVAAASLTEKTDQSQDMLHRAPGRPETFLQWEARRSGVSVKTKLNKKGRHLTAREFDLRFAR
jgi:hypothetical protein